MSKLNEQKIQQFFQDKLHDNMKIENNQYGCEFYTLYYNDFNILKEKDICKNGFKCIKEYSNGKTAQPQYQTVTNLNFTRFFKNNYSWEDFIADLFRIKTQFINDKIDEQKNNSNATAAILSLKDEGNDIRYKQVNLFSQSKFSNKYTTADKEFVFDKTFRDEQNNLYMYLNEKLYNLHFKQNSERVLLGNSTEKELQFWPAFFAENENNFDIWQDTIKKVIETYDKDTGISMEETIMNSGVPRIFLECIKIQIAQIGVETVDDKGKISKNWYYSGCDVLLDNGQNSSWTIDHMIDVYSNKLMNSVDVNKLKTIPKYTNDKNVIAVHYINRPLPVLYNEEPKLPKTWEIFLGNNRFIDEKMDKLKLAHFVDNVLNANYCGRQSLVIGGEGEDGKGTLVRVLNSIIGDDLACSMDVNDFSAENRFGLSKIFNKKLLALTDCKYVSKLFATDKFKSVTGSDPISIEFKNQKAVQFDTTGINIVICTNNPFYVSSEHGRTRVMPMVFQKNFDSKKQFDKNVLVANLISEKNEFIQWCVDYKNYFKEKYPLLFHGNSLTMCKDEDIENIENIDDVTLFKNMCEKQLLGNNKLCNWNEYTEEEEYILNTTSEIFEEMCVDIFKDYSYNKEYGRFSTEPKDSENFFIDENDNTCWMKTIELAKRMNDLISVCKALNVNENNNQKNFYSKLLSIRDKMIIKTNDKDFTNFAKLNYYTIQKYINGKRLSSIVDITKFINRTGGDLHYGSVPSPDVDFEKEFGYEDINDRI